MKKFLLVVLWVHILLEGLVSFALVFAPATVVPDASDGQLSGLVVQGFFAFSIVILAAWMIPYRNQPGVLTVGLGTLASCHTLILVSLLFTAPKTEELAGYAHHLILAVCFWMLWLRRQKLCE